MSERVERSLAWMLPSIGAGLFIALWLDYRDFWLDDSFITFRYARNWADGLGPNFNPGEAVEGYTTFSWLTLVAIAFRFGLITRVIDKTLKRLTGDFVSRQVEAARDPHAMLRLFDPSSHTVPLPIR